MHRLKSFRETHSSDNPVIISDNAPMWHWQQENSNWLRLLGDINSFVEVQYQRMKCVGTALLNVQFTNTNQNTDLSMETSEPGLATNTLHYILNFDKMTYLKPGSTNILNMKRSTYSQIKHIEQFLLEQCAPLNADLAHQHGFFVIPVPNYWQSVADLKTPLIPNHLSPTLMSVQPKSLLLDYIHRLMDNTPHGLVLTDVYANVNMEIWEKYMFLRSCHQRKGVLQERILFYGATEAGLKVITASGFDRCNHNPVMSGCSNSFSTSITYSSQQVLSPENENLPVYIIMSRVLVSRSRVMYTNQYQPGNFETTVDELMPPSVYVTHEDYQAYPEFVLKCNRSKQTAQ